MLFLNHLIPLFHPPYREESEDSRGWLQLMTTSFQYLLFQLVKSHLVCCQDLFASNPFSSWIALLKLLETQWLKSFQGQSCLLPVDMDAPESTFMNHCSKFLMFLVHILYLCFLLSSALFLERSPWEAVVLLCYQQPKTALQGAQNLLRELTVFTLVL